MTKTFELFGADRSRFISHIAGLLVFFIPFSSAISNLLMLLLTIVVISNNRNFNKFKFKPQAYILVFVLSILSLAICAIIKGSFIDDLNIHLRYFSVFLLFAIFFRINDVRLIENYYIAGITVAVIYSCIKIINYTYENPDFLFTTGDIINEILWEDRPFAAFSILIANFICLRRLAIEQEKRVIYFILMLTFFSFCIYISARLVIILSILVFVYFLFFKFKFAKRVKIFIGSAFFLFLAIAFITNRALIRRVSLEQETEIKKIYDKIKDREPRFVIWPCVLHLLEKDSNFLIGINNYSAYREDLVACYGETIKNREIKRKFYMDSRYNSHNQFLDFWLNGGILPFLLIVGSFVVAMLSKKTSPDAKIVLFLFFFFFLVENVLYRQMGIFIFGIFAVLYSNANNLKTQSKPL